MKTKNPPTQTISLRKRTSPTAPASVSKRLHLLQDQAAWPERKRRHNLLQALVLERKQRCSVQDAILRQGEAIGHLDGLLLLQPALLTEKRRERSRLPGPLLCGGLRANAHHNRSAPPTRGAGRSATPSESPRGRARSPPEAAPRPGTFHRSPRGPAGFCRSATSHATPRRASARARAPLRAAFRPRAPSSTPLTTQEGSASGKTKKD